MLIVHLVFFSFLLLSLFLKKVPVHVLAREHTIKCCCNQSYFFSLATPPTLPLLSHHHNYHHHQHHCPLSTRWQHTNSYTPTTVLQSVYSSNNSHATCDLIFDAGCFFACSFSCSFSYRALSSFVVRRCCLHFGFFFLIVLPRVKRLQRRMRRT